MQGADFKAKNSAFSSGTKSATFTTEIAGAYPEQAKVKSWIRTYTLNRGKNFVMRDRFELYEVVPGAATSSNLITCCKVTEVKPGLMKLEGNGFTMNMGYNAKIVRPVIEFREVTDRSLRRYWPDGVTRIRMEFIKPGLKGNLDLVFTAVR
jgi:hypothetical protein